MQLCCSSWLEPSLEIAGRRTKGFVEQDINSSWNLISEDVVQRPVPWGKRLRATCDAKKANHYFLQQVVGIKERCFSAAESIFFFSLSSPYSFLYVNVLNPARRNVTWGLVSPELQLNHLGQLLSNSDNRGKS